MSKRHDVVLENLAELEKAQREFVNSAMAVSDMSRISTQLMFYTALLADIDESLAIIADKIGGAE